MKFSVALKLISFWMATPTARKKPFRWNSGADNLLLQLIATERPTTSTAWDGIAVSINADFTEANVDKRGVKDRFIKVLLAGFKAEDRQKTNKYALHFNCLK